MGAVHTELGAVETLLALLLLPLVEVVALETDERSDEVEPPVVGRWWTTTGTGLGRLGLADDEGGTARDEVGREEGEGRSSLSTTMVLVVLC